VALAGIGEMTANASGYLHNILQAHVDRDAISGAVALIGRGDDSEVVRVGAAALHGARPMRRDMIFRIASMTKPITATAAMMLIEDGRVRLDEPVDRLLPELANRRVLKRIEGPLDDTEPARRAITVEDLLTFRLGLGIILAPPGTFPIQRAVTELGIMGFGPPDPTSPHDPDEWMRRLGTLPLMAQPGEQWLYTTGSNVLGVLVARASRQSLPAFLQERIFAPLGMVDTAFHVPPENLDRLPTGYRPKQHRWKLMTSPRGAAGARHRPFPPAMPAWSQRSTISLPSRGFCCGAAAPAIASSCLRLPSQA
jgi:CubicO group peptidase (beta-lactamase class C family)